MSPLHVVGMQGLGDSVHQRAVVRELLRDREVWLETPWPCLYHDLPEVRLVRPNTRLRTQAKNAAREAARYSPWPVPSTADMLDVSYPPAMVRKHRGVMAAMAAQCQVPQGDFRLPVPEAWRAAAIALLRRLGFDESRPLMIYRPLVQRRDWNGNVARNPDPAAYWQLYQSIRADFFVVSLADLEPGLEWSVSIADDADALLHDGPPIETVIGLFAIADLVFTGSGFAVPLAQAVGTPVVSLFGGYESSWSFSAAPWPERYLGIDPIVPCACFSHVHACDKRIDLPAAKAALRGFVAHCAEVV